jgi:hypothetical protein
MSIPAASPPTTWRRTLPTLAAVIYVAALDVWADRGAEPDAWLMGALAVVVTLVALRRARKVSRTLGTGLAVVLASLGAATPHAGVTAFGALGAMTCALCATVVIAQIPSDGGVVRPPPTSARPWAIAIVAAWWVALAAHAVPALGSAAWTGGDPRAWMAGAAGFTLAVLLAQAEWTLRRRRLELGVAARGVAIRGMLAVACVVVVGVALVGEGRGLGLGRMMVAGSSAIVAATAMARDAVRVARLSRRIITLVIVGGSVALLGASAAEGRGWQAWGVTLATGLITLVIGAGVALLEGPMRPARGAWLDAFTLATTEAGRGDPDDAIRAALLALRAPCGAQGASPELWTFSPTRVTTVDAAGYAQEREGELPEAIVLVSAAEPEATLRPEVLDALEVRRPELRPLGRWMSDRGALLATVVACEGETEAILMLPRGTRDEPLTLEEVRACKDMADRLAAACRARSTQARMLERAHDAMLRADATDQILDRLRHERALDVGRDALAATRLARPATVGVYSAASRMALEALERRTAVGAPISVVAPSGVDPVPYLARAHLAGTRREAPLVLVDATSAREHDPARWTEPDTSPLALADRGMLVLLDGAALPPEVQQIVARALAEKRAPWERPAPLDVQLALTGVAAPDELVTLGRLDAGLAARLADAGASAVQLPRLRDRAEDLRAILTDRLAREGLRVHGRPVGIEQAAYARLVEYPFPGEDAELGAIVQRLVARCQADVVRAPDVDALDLASALPGAPAHPAVQRKDPLSA